ncbi:hypothetical protein [Bifidobacterium xylocopae]|uniref:Uncharacterized protein n=1 Tax=Bifidobacterium xylocopae TaxID=2493119 RepID=A0A366KAS4_9BIFI|nr:hypothetical protein [Bifidobacterium xylocopae]RBP98835.1 hypothetical protein CRD59_07015 [Bifidobacterium xylocopae]
MMTTSIPGATTGATSLLASRAVAADDGGMSNLKPNMGYFPWNATLRDIAGGLQGTVLWCLVILLIVAAVGFIASRVLSSGNMQHYSWILMIGCLIVAAIVASAGGIIWWASGIPVFTTSKAATGALVMQGSLSTFVGLAA